MSHELREGKSNSSQQELNTTLSVVNTTLLSWCLIEEGHRDVDAGQGTPLVQLFLFISWRAQKGHRNRVKQGGTVECQIVP